MDRLAWPTILWRQFGAALDTLEEAIAACPDALWTHPLWRDPASRFPPRFSEFWYVAYHSLVWLDVYGQGVPEEAFSPPPPFLPGEIDSAGSMPEQPYRKEDLLVYLAALRDRCRGVLTGLTPEQAARPVDYPWITHTPISYLELQLYLMRHAQEHAAQLSLVIGQQGDPDHGLGWITSARTAAGGE